MTASLAVDLARLGWLVLAVMMLGSRFVFQRAGAIEMRRFLDKWSESRTKRIWGGLTLAYAAAVAVAFAIAPSDDLRTSDWIVGLLLILVLVVDGAVNVLPAGFQTFKDSVQEAWVARTGQRRTEGDPSMFAWINAGLAAASLIVGVAVLSYRQFDLWLPIASLLIGSALMWTLIRGTRAE